MRSSVATDSTSANSTAGAPNKNFNFLDALNKLKKLNSNMDVVKPIETKTTEVEKELSVKTEESYEEKKKKELAKRVIREFTRAESLRDATEPMREENRKKIEAILKAKETIRQAPKAAVERWQKLDRLNSFEVKRLSGEFVLYNDYTQLTVTDNM